MKQFLYAIAIVTIIQFFIGSCANPISPTGGPKDTLAPVLLHSYPEDQTLNFKDNIISLDFDEFINADKIKQNLIITPITDISYKSFVKKRNITLTFTEPFQDSTTYTFNFFDGVTDITEKNPAENLILAFSTGDFIDSLYMYGSISDLFNDKPSDKTTVGIYKVTDTLDFNKVKPTYFTTTDENGSFYIQNIKAGDYKILAFLDENKNLQFDASSEAYGFKQDTLHIFESIQDSIELKTVAIDASPIQLTSARASGLYYELRYSKPIVSYQIQNADDLYLPSKISGESETVRIYPLSLPKDSTLTYVTVFDSLKNSKTDTVFVKFKESSRKQEEFKYSMLPKSGSAVFTDQHYQIQFNKPVVLLDTNFLNVKIDTIFQLDYKPKNISFNYNYTQLFFSLDINPKNYLDSINQLIQQYPFDSTHTDSTNYPINRKLNSLPKDRFTITIKDKIIHSVEGDTIKSIEGNYKFADQSKFGLVRVTLNTEETHFIVQLMSKDKAVRSMSNCTNCTFNSLPPGDYWLRILIDQNQDGKWSYGNFLQNEEPEPVLYFPEKTTLRANWEVELEYSF